MSYRCGHVGDSSCGSGVGPDFGLKLIIVAGTRISVKAAISLAADRLSISLDVSG